MNKTLLDRYQNFDLGEADIIGKTDFDLFPLQNPSSRAGNAAAFYEQEQAIMRTGEPLIDQEMPPHKNKDNQIVWTQQTKVPYYNNASNIIGIIGINKNVSDRKRADLAERKTDILKAELQKETELAELKSQLTDTIAHEFRSPTVYHFDLYDHVAGKYYNELSEGKAP